MTTKKNGKNFVILCGYGYTADATIISSEEEILNAIVDLVSSGWDEDEIEVYELGRKGVLPKRTIQFI